MKLPGYCDTCHRPRNVSVSASGVAMVAAHGIAHGICDECSSAPRSITCPRCSCTSYNRTDIEVGWCARCGTFTGKPLAKVERVLSAMRQRRDPSAPGVARRLAQAKEDRQGGMR